MKTIFHDKESGTKLEMEGTFANSKAQLVDDEGNVTTELEGSYSEILEMISQLSGNDDKGKEEPQEACEAIVEGKENLTNSDFRGAKVKVLEDIEDKDGDSVKAGAITRDVSILDGEDLLVEFTIVKPKDFNKLEILTDGQKNIQKGDYVKVKEGKECGGAKGFAIVTDIEGDNVRLKGIDENSYYRETWINSVDNVIKIG